MGGNRFQTQAGDYAAKAITIPINGSAATLLSLIGTLALTDQMGNALGDVSVNLHRVTAVRITGQSAAFLYGKTATTAVVPQLATVDMVEPVGGTVVLNSFFQSTTGIAVTAVAEVYFD